MKKYPSCRANIGRFCTKHGVIHQIRKSFPELNIWVLNHYGSAKEEIFKAKEVRAWSKALALRLDHLIYSIPAGKEREEGRLVLNELLRVSKK